MFVYPAFLWLFPLLGLVVLIHLINMFRHRNVDWGAMEFLLEGYRKSRARILFRQLLLMLLRMGAIGAVILMLAQPKLEGTLAEWFGGKATHHVVLLDDSYSMNDRSAVQGGTPLFEDALAVVRRVLDGAVRRNRGDRLTLIRLSRADAVRAGEDPDIAELSLNPEGLQIIGDFLGSLQASQSALEPEILFEAAVELVRRSNTANKPLVYFLSDFRQRNWTSPSTALDAIGEIRRLGGGIRMIRTAGNEHPNIGIANLEAVDGIHAADIDLLLDADIVNHGREDVENIHLALLIDGESHPGLTVPNIRSGEHTVPPVRFPVRFDGSGRHRVELRLSADSIPDDNRRFLVVDVPAVLEVLLISPEGRSMGSETSAPFVRVALSPGGARSGIRVRIEPPSFLADHPLEHFGAIFLLDLPMLDASNTAALEEYVRRGGGVAFFPGPETDVNFVRNELYKNGDGLFPCSPVAIASLEPDFLARMPDLTVSPHPIFRLFGEGESPLLGSVRIERYLGVENDLPTGDVIGRLRNGAPLVVEKEFGKGRTIAFLTTAAPIWNNWARGNPSFVVVMLELAARLSKRSSEKDSFLVGDSLFVDFDPSAFETAVRFGIPARDEQSRETGISIEAASTQEGSVRATLSHADVSGFYEATLKERSGKESKRFLAVNVDASEGDTRLADPGELSSFLRPVGVSLESAAGFSSSTDIGGDRPLSDWFLFAVVIFLVGETFLAGRLLKG